MTTAIEQAKREMYSRLEQLKTNADMLHLPELRKMLERFEGCSESYLEQLRQQYEEMASTAHQRFESIQSLEAANAELQMKNDAQRGIIEGAGGTNELSYQLAKMTESRDMFRNLHQAATHASIESSGNPGTPHQYSGDRASCEQPDANVIAIHGAVRRIQMVITDWGFSDLKSKKAMRQIARIVNGDGEVVTALGELEKSSCPHSFFAIGDDKMKCTFCGVGK